MEIDDTILSTEDQPYTVNDIDLHDIDEVLIRNNIILKRKFVFKTVNELVSDFKILNDLLPGQTQLNRSILKEKVLAKISAKHMGEVLYGKVVDWITREGSILVVEYLPYLSMGCDMNFHRCTIERYHNRTILVADKKDHDISKTIYYICDESGRNITAIFLTDYAYINHIQDTLLLQSDNNVNVKIELYNKLIVEHIIQTKNLQFHHHLLLLSQWQNIYKFYKARMLLKCELTGDQLLDYCRCLIILNKYSTAEKQITKLLSGKSVRTDEGWYMLATAQRKRKNYLDSDNERQNYENYSKAESSIAMAVRVNGSNESALKEQIIIKKLRTRILSSEASLPYTVIHSKQKDNCPSYNILSIDGGGIRGLMAAIWLRELERKTKYTCSSMFQMMAGTSTGAIIAAGLSTPGEKNTTGPDYNAATLVTLYKTRGRDIFVKKSRHPFNWHRIPHSLAPEYTSENKQMLFKQYFRDTRLHDCLTDILIPVVKTGDTHTHLFTRDNSSYSTSLVDVLMATTAAPTYFKPHYFNDTTYIDGGVQMNNPTLAAYVKALEYGHVKENIFVLSLGTSDYIEEPLATTTHRDIFYYKRHKETVVKVLIDSQQHNVDYQMSKIMNDENYYRWQVWLEEAIDLDRYEESIVNRLENMAYEYWEEMEMHDSNRLNRLIERFRARLE